jgi:hypothetical protein
VDFFEDDDVSTALVVRFHDNVVTNTPRVSIQSSLDVPVLLRESTSNEQTRCTPMRSLVPYISPRRVEKPIVLIPSVREYQDWIPTNHRTSSETPTTTESNGTVFQYLPDYCTETMSFTECVYRKHLWDQKVLFLQNLEFREHTLVMFYMSNGRHDTDLPVVPLWTNLMKAVEEEGLPISMQTWNCSELPDFCRERGCNDFPTIRWSYKGAVLIDDLNGDHGDRPILQILELIVKTLKKPMEESVRRSHLPQPPMTNALIPAIAPKNSDFMLHDERGNVSRMDQRLKSITFMRKQRMRMIMTPSPSSTPVVIDDRRFTTTAVYPMDKVHSNVVSMHG